MQDLAVDGGVPLSVGVPMAELVAVVLPAHTVVARTVVGLAPPRAGRVLVGGRDVTGAPPGQRQIGYVPAGAALLPHLTVRENIEYARTRRRGAVTGLSLTWQYHLVRALELEPVLHERPHRVSPAQQWRVALARAVVTLPEVLVIDLPGGNRPGSRGDPGRAELQWSVPAVPLRDLLERARLSPAGAPATLLLTADPAVAAVADRVLAPAAGPGR